MSRFAHLMREHIVWRQRMGINATGGVLYADPAIILGRLEWHRQKILNDRGEEAISEAVLYTQSRLQPGDLIVHEGKNWPIQAVRERKGLYGATDHWEVRL